MSSSHFGQGCERTTLGAIPGVAEYHVFTVGRDDDLHVVYVGLAEELRMVTSGPLGVREGTPSEVVRAAEGPRGRPMSDASPFRREQLSRFETTRLTGLRLLERMVDPCRR